MRKIPKYTDLNDFLKKDTKILDRQDATLYSNLQNTFTLLNVSLFGMCV